MKQEVKRKTNGSKDKKGHECVFEKFSQAFFIASSFNLGSCNFDKFRQNWVVGKNRNISKNTLHRLSCDQFALGSFCLCTQRFCAHLSMRSYVGAQFSCVQVNMLKFHEMIAAFEVFSPIKSIKFQFLCYTVPFIELAVSHASVLTILAITVERFYAICRPLRAGEVCTKTKAFVTCIIAWLISFGSTAPILNIVQYTEEGSTAVCLCEINIIWQRVYFILIITAFFFIPFVVLVVLYNIIRKDLFPGQLVRSLSNATIDLEGYMIG